MGSLLYILLMLGISTASGAAEVPPDKEIILFEHEKLGTVTFLHKMHSTLDGVECTTCHHTLEDSGKPEDCHKCHQSKPTDETPKSMKAFHTRCRGCHEYTVESGKKAGPVKKCKLCHVKPDREQKMDTDKEAAPPD